MYGLIICQQFCEKKLNISLGKSGKIKDNDYTNKSTKGNCFAKYHEV